ncbi:MAG: FtsX-like permease family protein [Phycisphaerae bacterium]
MLKLFLWLRYLRKKKMVLLAVAAVTLSVSLMIVVDSLFTGYINALKTMTASETGEIFFWARGTGIPEYDLFLNQLEQLEGVKAAAPFNFGAGLLYLEGGDVREVVIHGIDPERERRFSNWGEKLVGIRTHTEKPAEQDNQAWIGINIIAEPDEVTDEYDLEQASKYIGSEALLITVGSGKKRHVEKLVISDIIFSKTYFGDKTLYLPYEQFHKIQFPDDEIKNVRYVKVKLHDGVNSESLVEPIEAVWRNFAVEELGMHPTAVPGLSIKLEQDLHRDIFADLYNQLRVTLIIFAVICSVAVLLIFCIFYMIVTTRQKDIAVIKSCGASSLTAAGIFGGFGVFAGVVGSLLGLVLGTVITKNVNIIEEWIRIIFGIKLWRTSSYGLAFIPHQVNWVDVPAIMAAAILGCLIGVLIPSIIAARTKPVEILRYE